MSVTNPTPRHVTLWAHTRQWDAAWTHTAPMHQFHAEQSTPTPRGMVPLRREMSSACCNRPMYSDAVIAAAVQARGTIPETCFTRLGDIQATLRKAQTIIDAREQAQERRRRNEYARRTAPLLALPEPGATVRAVHVTQPVELPAQSPPVSGGDNEESSQQPQPEQAVPSVAVAAPCPLCTDCAAKLARYREVVADKSRLVAQQGEEITALKEAVATMTETVETLRTEAHHLQQQKESAAGEAAPAEPCPPCIDTSRGLVVQLRMELARVRAEADNSVAFAREAVTKEHEISSALRAQVETLKAAVAVEKAESKSSDAIIFRVLDEKTAVQKEVTALNKRVEVAEATARSAVADARFYSRMWTTADATTDAVRKELWTANQALQSVIRLATTVEAEDLPFTTQVLPKASLVGGERNPTTDVDRVLHLLSQYHATFDELRRMLGNLEEAAVDAGVSAHAAFEDVPTGGLVDRIVDTAYALAGRKFQDQVDDAFERGVAAGRRSAAVDEPQHKPSTHEDTAGGVSSAGSAPTISATTATTTASTVPHVWATMAELPAFPYG